MVDTSEELIFFISERNTEKIAILFSKYFPMTEPVMMQMSCFVCYATTHS